MDRVLKMTPYPKLYEENCSLHLIRYFDLITCKYFKIMNLGIKQLSEFGYGYLVGKIILFLVFVVVYGTRKQNIKS